MPDTGTWWSRRWSTKPAQPSMTAHGTRGCRIHREKAASSAASGPVPRRTDRVLLYRLLCSSPAFGGVEHLKTDAEISAVDQHRRDHLAGASAVVSPRHPSGGADPPSPAAKRAVGMVDKYPRHFAKGCPDGFAGLNDYIYILALNAVLVHTAARSLGLPGFSEKAEAGRPPVLVRAGRALHHPRRPTGHHAEAVPRELRGDGDVRAGLPATPEAT
jgi:hypothetical protein